MNNTTIVNNSLEDVVYSSKVNMLLLYCNELLKHIKDSKPILDPVEFKNINRLDIVKEEGQQVFRDMMGDIYKIFDKTKCGYYNRKAPNSSLNVLRRMCRDCGYLLLRKKKEETLKECLYRTSYFYSIIKAD